MPGQLATTTPRRGGPGTSPARPVDGLPPLLDEVLDRHRARAVAAARGRVLVVGSVPLPAVAGAITEVTAAHGRIGSYAGQADPLALPGTPPPTPGPGPVHDTIVSVGGLLGEPDLPAALAALDSLLAPGGRLLLVESTRPWRRAAGALASVPRVWRGVDHLHLQRDLVGATWAHGFAPLVVERFTVPTPIIPLRSWGYVTAARLDEVSTGAWS